jgi:hypothetical protein
LFQRDHFGFAKGPDPAAPERANVTEDPERPAEITRQRADIGPLAAFRGKHGMIPVGDFDKFQAVDRHRPRRELDRLAVAGQVIGPFAAKLGRRYRALRPISR